MTVLRCAPAGVPPSRVEIGARILPDVRRALAERCGGAPVFTVCDAGCLRGGPAPEPGIVLRGGEHLKTFTELERLLRSLARAGFDRSLTIVALGGGAVGDLAGLAAALFLRGVALVQVPTTLLAMVDSSVGGKTAVDLPEGKNLAGTLWPAREVWIDPAFTATLPEREFRSGLGEVLKVAIGLDAELFRLLEDRAPAVLARDPGVLREIVERCVRAKIAIVEQDPREAGPRRLLNLGHTLGHALETASRHTLAHGVAVGAGLHHAVRVAVRRGILAAETGARCRALLERYGLPPDPGHRADDDRLLELLGRDKKRADGALLAVLPTAIGACLVEATTPSEFLRDGT